MNDIKELSLIINNFHEERNWGQFHNEKDLSLSISLEANELLENFQWKTSEEAVRENKEEIAEELADVLIYSITLANKLNLDIAKIIKDKMEKNAIKYPIEKSKNSKKKYTEF